MIKHTLYSLLPLILASCSSMNLSSRIDSYDTEMTLHKLRADIEEMKHDLHTNKIGLNIIEGKIVNHEDTVTSLKRNTLDSHLTKLEKALSQLNHIESKFENLEKKYEKTEKALLALQDSSNMMCTSLKQSKEKVADIESALSIQLTQLSEIAQLKKNLIQISALIKGPFPHFAFNSHRVKSGETVETIANEYKADPILIKEINLLEGEEVVPGQSLFIPILSEQSKKN